jgi:hypothetical protein
MTSEIDQVRILWSELLPAIGRVAELAPKFLTAADRCVAALTAADAASGQTKQEVEAAKVAATVALADAKNKASQMKQALATLSA